MEEGGKRSRCRKKPFIWRKREEDVVGGGGSGGGGLTTDGDRQTGTDETEGGQANKSARREKKEKKKRCGMRRGAQEKPDPENGNAISQKNRIVVGVLLYWGWYGWLDVWLWLLRHAPWAPRMRRRRRRRRAARPAKRLDCSVVDPWWRGTERAWVSFFFPLFFCSLLCYLTGTRAGWSASGESARG